MDFSNDDHDDRTFFSEQKESHWQPALRPDTEEEEDDHDHAPQVSSPHQLDAATDMTNTQGIAQEQSHPHVSFVPSDDDSEEHEDLGRLDPAWGIRRTDSAHILDTVQRSSSFPAPEPDHDLSAAQYISQQSEDLQPSLQETSHTFSQWSPDLEDEPATLYSAHDAETIMQEEQDQLTPIETFENQEETRFDEGVPLMMAEHETPESSEIEQPPTTTALDHATTNTSHTADDLLSQSDQKSLPPVDSRPSIERKETAAVLDGLGVLNAPPDSPQKPPKEDVKDNDFTAAFAEELDEAFAQHLNLGDDQNDPWKAALDDDEDFLLEDADDLLPDSDEEADDVPALLPPQSRRPTAAINQSSAFARSNSNPYAPHQPSTSELTHFAPTTQGPGFSRQLQNPANAFRPAQQPNITNRAESFVDQSKGGYKSPYDLPMDLAPKKRVQSQRIVPPVNNAPPPPRSSSINTDKQLQSSFTPSAPMFNDSVAATSIVPTPIDRSMGISNQPPRPTNQRAASGFFEELPVVPRVRPSQVAPRAPVAQAPSGPPRQTFPGPAAASTPQIQNQVAPPQQDPYAQYQLQPPTKLDPYANTALQPTQASLAPAPPVVASRYSPAPPTLQNGVKPSPSPRYSPAPPAQAVGPRYSPAPSAQTNGPSRYVSQPVPGTSLPFQPRTSSPLAQPRYSVDRSTGGEQVRPTVHHTMSASVPLTADFSQDSANILPPSRGIDPIKQDIVLPPRSQTQSPSRQLSRPNVPSRIVPSINRPTSALGQLSASRSQPVQSIMSPPRANLPARPIEQVDYIKPTDGTEHDPLERYKGTPIFRFGFGGTVITSFPVRVPRFNAASIRPQIKASPGEVQIKKLDTIVNTPNNVSKFPGPLKGKAKKKDVLTWLVSSISSLETEATVNPSKRLEEKILLWKIVKVLVEQDGNLENPQAVQSVGAYLMPEAYAPDDTAVDQNGVDNMSTGTYRPASLTAKAEIVDPAAVDKLRKTLLKGKREDAIWQAVDNRLWSHAFLLASTLDKTIWKQVVTEFVKQEVKTIGSSADSLCALYEIFGGNMDESIDQLVPPSARAGLQMVSKVETTGPTRNALDGLDRWKETLCLILNNRSMEDQRALISLARLLTDYGRVEAAHICYLFARSPSIPHILGGADDQASMVVLLGADHRVQSQRLHIDTDSILLTEVYEYAVSTLAQGSTGALMPHLAAYKLQRANELADAGMKTEAQAYCDTIASSLKSSTKHSLYYNPLLLGEVEDLSNRLKQIPVTSASWIGKPSIEKVSGSVWNKFTTFVTGEDSDADSKGSARDAAEAGPFAKVSGSPTLSRNASQTDLYGGYPTQTTAGVPATTAASRYAPNGLHSTRSSSDMTRARTSMDYQWSPPSTSHSNEPRNLFAPLVQPQQSAHSPLTSPPVSAYHPDAASQPTPNPVMPIVAKEAMPVSQANMYVPEGQPNAQDSPLAAFNNSTPPQPAFGGYLPMEPLPQISHDTPAEPSSTLEQSQSSFEPYANNTGYEAYQPPEDSGYSPYQPEPDSDSEKPKPKKKSFMNNDDDDGFAQGPNRNVSAAPISSTDGNKDDAQERARKKANDEAAEAAFRAAAEADAQQNKDQASDKKASGSWLGGWFGGGKKPESLDAAPSKSSNDPKVHRVHLGESKMKLYYDKDKKKWINPDNPEASEKKAAAPPPRGSTGSVPPMGGPPRSVSTPYSLPAGGLSRSGTPMSQAVDTGSEGGDSRPGTGNGQAPGFAAMLPPGTAQSLGLNSGSSMPTLPSMNGSQPTTGNASGPPSRPASALSNASGLDDLLGGPPTAGGRKVSGRMAKGKKGRYVDVMAK